ncbi:SLATT domain-containing protein [Streptomyces sp. WMMC905]|uniref:SLATT domain-containing protein n=1 Tax=Streptomyces sp. WMMC905 TaxID=3404123 RepID=UPI003B940F1E
MGQPEKQPEKPSPGGRAGEGAGFGAPPRARHDLRGRTFPHGDWSCPADRLDELYRWVERGALDTVEWYLAGRARKRRGARLLRGGAAAGAVAGAALPLLDMTGVVAGAAPWGYLSLLLGLACVVGDRYFAVTSGWMRDMATAQAVQRRVQALQFDWASESVREVLGPAEGTAGEATERCLSVLRRFSEDVTELVRAETAAWMAEFGGGSAPEAPAGPSPAGAPPARPEAAPGAGRFGVPPPAGPRPHMPRQRPPEPRG